MKTPTIEALKAALNALENLNAVSLLEEFREFEHNCTPGTYVALRLDPATGDTWTFNDASWSCSTDEYFSERGVLSTQTLLSSTRAHWSPSPDDGFEWAEGDDYVYPAGDCAAWITADAFAELDQEDQAKYTEWFSVSGVPVDGWVPEGNSDMAARDVEKQIAELREAIEQAIEELQSNEAGA